MKLFSGTQEKIIGALGVLNREGANHIAAADDTTLAHKAMSSRLEQPTLTLNSKNALASSARGRLETVMTV